MSAPSSEHGSWASYQRGCRLNCCTTAARNYQKGRVIDAHRGQPRTVSSLGTRRRVEALACLGWSGYDISVRLGHGREWLRQVLMRDQIHRRTHDRIAEVYETLAMTLPPQDTAARRQMVGRTKARAARNGWVPPLAWDDIDNDPAPPTVEPAGNYEDSIDHAVVQRVVDGHGRPRKLTRAEATECVRRLLLLGLSTYCIENDYGFKVERYERTAA